LHLPPAVCSKPIGATKLEIIAPRSRSGAYLIQNSGANVWKESRGAASSRLINICVLTHPGAAGRRFLWLGRHRKLGCLFRDPGEGRLNLLPLSAKRGRRHDRNTTDERAWAIRPAADLVGRPRGSLVDAFDSSPTPCSVPRANSLVVIRHPRPRCDAARRDPDARWEADWAGQGVPQRTSGQSPPNRNLGRWLYVDQANSHHRRRRNATRASAAPPHPTSAPRGSITKSAAVKGGSVTKSVAAKGSSTALPPPATGGPPPNLTMPPP
jgi:hypothetical protein